MYLTVLDIDDNNNNNNNNNTSYLYSKSAY